jgi:hypothetical protein
MKTSNPGAWSAMKKRSTLDAVVFLQILGHARPLSFSTSF